MSVFLAQFGVTKGDILGAIMWSAVIWMTVDAWDRMPVWGLIFQAFLFVLAWSLRIIRWVKTWQNTVTVQESGENLPERR